MGLCEPQISSEFAIFNHETLLRMSNVGFNRSTAFAGFAPPKDIGLLSASLFFSLDFKIGGAQSFFGSEFPLSAQYLLKRLSYA